jgi:PAS domain S-box-containing protein
MAEAMQERSSGLSVRKARVLLVDDNVDLVDGLKMTLESNVFAASLPGIEVVSAASGAHALEIARTDGFDIAIVDVKLPDVSGVDLIAQLRATRPKSEVLLMTGNATLDTAIGALKGGAFAFVLKSFRPEDLCATVEQALTKVELVREREELEGRYRDLVELTDVLVVSLNESLQVSLLNQKTTSLAGLSREDMLGKPFVDSWIRAADRARVRDALQATFRDHAVREVEADFVGREPSRRIRWHLSHIGGLVSGIGVDVTDRRALEKRAADSEALSAMGTLAMNLAHEIRNPLNAAVLQLHLLGRQLQRLPIEDATVQALLGRTDIVREEIARLNRMLTEFLDLARPRGIASEAVDVGLLLGEVIAFEREAAAARGISIDYEAPERLTLALGDREKLKQVILNLVVNAFEAMKEGGSLQVRALASAESVSIVLVDNGPGIEPDVLTNIFDPFFTTKEAGTGLGLSIVRKVLDQHRGKIDIASTRGVGTTVTVELRRYQERAE